MEPRGQNASPVLKVLPPPRGGGGDPPPLIRVGLPTPPVRLRPGGHRPLGNFSADVGLGPGGMKRTKNTK